MGGSNDKIQQRNKNYNLLFHVSCNSKATLKLDHHKDNLWCPKTKMLAFI